MYIYHYKSCWIYHLIVLIATSVGNQLKSSNNIDVIFSASVYILNHLFGVILPKDNLKSVSQIFSKSSYSMVTPFCTSNVPVFGAKLNVSSMYSQTKWVIKNLGYRLVVIHGRNNPYKISVILAFYGSPFRTYQIFFGIRYNEFLNSGNY